MTVGKVKDVEKRFLSNREAQKYLDVGEEFMKSMRDNAKIHYYKIGRRIFYKVSDLNELIERAQVI